MEVSASPTIPRLAAGDSGIVHCQLSIVNSVKMEESLGGLRPPNAKDYSKDSIPSTGWFCSVSQFSSSSPSVVTVSSAIRSQKFSMP